MSQGLFTESPASPSRPTSIAIFCTACSAACVETTRSPVSETVTHSELTVIARPAFASSSRYAETTCSSVASSMLRPSARMNEETTGASASLLACTCEKSIWASIPKPAFPDALQETEILRPGPFLCDSTWEVRTPLFGAAPPPGAFYTIGTQQRGPNDGSQ